VAGRACEPVPDGPFGAAPDGERVLSALKALPELWGGGRNKAVGEEIDQELLIGSCASWCCPGRSWCWRVAGVESRHRGLSEYVVLSALFIQGSAGRSRPAGIATATSTTPSATSAPVGQRWAFAPSEDRNQIGAVVEHLLASSAGRSCPARIETTARLGTRSPALAGGVVFRFVSSGTPRLRMNPVLGPFGCRCRMVELGGRFLSGWVSMVASFVGGRAM